jgi:hypothetical protein
MPCRILQGLVCLGVCCQGGTDCQLLRIQRPALESTYMMLVELDPSLILACTLPYDHTNSYRISCDIQDVNPC